MPYAMIDYPQAVVVKGIVCVGGGKAPLNKIQQTVMVYACGVSDRLCHGDGDGMGGATNFCWL